MGGGAAATALGTDRVAGFGAGGAAGHFATPSALDDLAGRIVPRIELEIEAAVRREVDDPWMRGAIGYQLGWADASFAALAPEHRRATGKRLRPLLAVLSFLAAGAATHWDATASADLDDVVTFAAAVELIHNFSLIHDDIEDRDRARRGRPTLWTLCGEAQAINVGDCVQALAYASLSRLQRRQEGDPSLVGRLVSALASTTVALTIGQSRDMAYETSEAVDPAMYMAMIAGKTAALTSCATHGGALLAVGSDGAPATRIAAGYAEFGRELGLCYQVRDDILGMWGCEAETGKSSSGDIRRRKKSLPVVLAVSVATDRARERLLELYALPAELDDAQEREIRAILEGCGVEALCQREAELHAERSLAALSEAQAGRAESNPFAATLGALAGSLTARSR
ncbi:MAG: geranylgeranyl diphosphate synthase, type [Solirubrobacteraceae bacterium]|jgi:geranylgeranyl diphosphate synthase type I|nr:geranylgeranyl diphosphate synthase, type [Solirubrobacteraceae bacterium]